jgi:dimethylaniline monooxygenase (N-oxide forming)
VTRTDPAPGGGWDVTVRQRDTGARRTERYHAVLVANGHHWDPRYPEPAFPGASTFTGTQIHSHHYRTPEPFTGQRVLVLGIGNSACDVATDCSQVAARTLLAMRRGVHVVPKYLFGMPTDHLTLMRLGTKAPVRLQGSVVALLVRIAQGKVTKYGLPKPDHQMLCAPPTVSGSLLSRLDHGDIVVKPVTAKRYARSTRHAIQVDFLAYLREIRRERQVGARRNGVPRTTAVDPPAPRILQQATTSSQA